MRSGNTFFSIFSFVTIPLTEIWRGYVLQVLWGWFVVHTFGLRPLGIAQAIGLALTASVFTGVWGLALHIGLMIKEEDRNDALVRNFLYRTAVPLFLLGVGWTANQFI